MESAKTIEQKKIISNESLSRQDINIYLISIVAVCLGVYSSCFFNKFVNWDDVPYVIENSTIKSWTWGNLKSMFTTYTFGNYHPLTLLSLSIDYHIAKLNPNWYHLNNVLLHLFNTLLVFKLINLITGNSKIALITMALFGLHPIHVESIGWISERKDVLYAFFYLFSLTSYLKYKITNLAGYYRLSLIFFFLSILSKGMAVSLPPILLLIDWLMGYKIMDRKNLIEKIPFFLLSFFFGIVAIYAQKSADAITANDTWSFHERFILAGYAFMKYIFNLVWPLNLSPLYPYPIKIGNNLPLDVWLYGLASLLLAIFILAMWWLRSTGLYIRWICFGFAFFFITIFMVLQLLPVGKYIMADRYAYMPSIGFCFIVALGFCYVDERIKTVKPVLYFISLFYLLFISIVTYNQGKIWKDDVSLWSKAIQCFPNYIESYQLRGNANTTAKKYREALKDYNKIISFYPKNGFGYFLRGKTMFILNQAEPAIADYTKSIQLMSNKPDIHLVHLVESDPKKDIVSVYLNRAAAYLQIGKENLAFADFDMAKKLDPDNPEIYINLGIIETKKKSYDKSLNLFSKAIILQPDLGEAYFHRGYVYYLLKDYYKTIKDCNNSINKRWHKAEVYQTRGLAYIQTNKYLKALADFNFAIELEPNMAEAYYNRGYLKWQLNKKTGACEDLYKSKQLGFTPADSLINSFCY